MFYRSTLKFLNNWRIKSDRKPLVIRGARQVGKTTLVEIFSKGFRQYISLNLEFPSDRKIFEEKQNFDEVLDALFFNKNGDRKISDTLIFIDEIQNCPEAIKYLRYFYENKKEYAVITAGSLLETLLNEDVTYPVGRVEFLAVRPFSFIEFLSALEEKNALEVMNTIPFPEFAHQKLMTLFRRYTLLGGMPAVIKNYAENMNLNETKSIIGNLILSYKSDIEKYARNETVNKIIRHIIDNVFYFAAERIKFNRFANSDYRSREVGGCFRILEKTMLIELVYPVTSVKLPFIPNKRKSPKLQILDTGLVNFYSGIEKDLFDSQDLTDVYKGRIAEHIIGQELLSLENSPSYNLNFWIRDKMQTNAEIDFVYNHKGDLIPIEIKSGTSGKLRSLHQFINISPSLENLAVRFYSGKLQLATERTVEGKEFKLLNLPFYLCNKIEEYLEWAKKNSYPLRNN